MLYVYCHPVNLELIKNIVKEDREKRMDEFTMNRNPFFHINFIVNDILPIEKTYYSILKNRFYSYWDGKGEVPSWCLYFGFVKELKCPYFLQQKSCAVVMGRNGIEYAK